LEAGFMNAYLLSKFFESFRGDRRSNTESNIPIASEQIIDEQNHSISVFLEYYQFKAFEAGVITGIPTIEKYSVPEMASGQIYLDPAKVQCSAGGITERKCTYKF